jgi:hypothetical protein
MPVNPSTQEAEAGGFQVQGQAGLHSETLSQKRIFIMSLWGLKLMTLLITIQFLLPT